MLISIISSIIFTGSAAVNFCNNMATISGVYIFTAT